VLLYLQVQVQWKVKVLNRPKQFRVYLLIVHCHLILVQALKQVLHQKVHNHHSHQGVYPVIAHYQANRHNQATVPSQVDHPHRTAVYLQSVHNHHGVVTQATVPSRRAVRYLYPRNLVTHHYRVSRPNQARRPSQASQSQVYHPSQVIVVIRRIPVLHPILRKAVYPASHLHPSHRKVSHRKVLNLVKVPTVHTVRNRLHRHRVVKVQNQV
jgi:hypothetical protein